MGRKETGEGLRAGDAAERSNAARLMGRSRSEKKTAAARLNAQKTYKPMKRLVDIACPCGLAAGDAGLPPFKHKSTCLRGRAIKYRQAKGLALT